MTSEEIIKASNNVISITNGGFRKGQRFTMHVAKRRSGKSQMSTYYWNHDPNLIRYSLPLEQDNK